MKVLTFQTAFLGDLILTSPLLKSLKKSLKGELHLVVRKGLEDVYKGFWAVDKVIPFDKKGIFNLANQLKKEKYSLAISPHRSHRTSLILFLSGIKRRIGYDKAGFSFLYTDRVKHEFKEGYHEVERLLKLTEPLKREFQIEIEKKLELPLKEEEKLKTREKFKIKNRYAVLAPGSVWPTKAWLPEYFAEVGRWLIKVGLMPVIIGAKGDYKYCKEVEKELPLSLNLCGKTTLREFFSIIEGAEVVISNDSAPVHAACALKTPVVEIYGPTIPRFGFFPYGKGKIVELKGLKCRPCSIHGGKKCKEGDFKCMKDLKPERVIKATKELLNC